MTTEDTKCTVGKTIFFQGENQTHPLFRIEPGISSQNAREHRRSRCQPPRWTLRGHARSHRGRVALAK
ncbi:hypothetical protein [Pseudomonas sp. Kh13]|uniref:hypothetical protein n=1 Tax=Pseudomonas sp. Kh13 TaxID=2093744 RepID=UPI00118350FB|nr:hypothetical protein [Pseudomonas sp. Kh13]